MLGRDTRILIVDDQVANVTMLERMLEVAGAAATVGTTDPLEATTLFASFAPDLVLLDLHMPRMDGFMVMEALRAIIPEDSFVPIVVLTADDSRATMERALAAGAKDFLTKPFDFTEVILRIGNLLETRSLHLKLHAEKMVLEEKVRHRAEEQARAEETRRRLSAGINEVLGGSGLAMVFQPISDLRSGQVRGVEALARFAGRPSRAPDLWFAQAADLGLGTQLEVVAVAMALGATDLVPPGAYLAVNVSPETVKAAALTELLRSAPVHRLVLEVTEHAPVDDYGALDEALRPLRARGLRIAVDDAGAGFASLSHILRLRPDIIKLDCALTRGVDTDPVRRVLASSMVAFAAEMAATVTAEGVESARQRDVLRDLGVTHGQGYYLARPAPLP